MDLFKAKLLTYTIAFGLIISSVIGFGLSYLYPEFDLNWFFCIAVYFLVMETFLIYMTVTGGQKNEKKKMVNLYMLTKVIKVVTSLLFITVYILAVKQNTKIFVSAFILFYLTYLIAETFLFVNIEKHIKEKNTNNE